MSGDTVNHLLHAITGLLGAVGAILSTLLAFVVKRRTKERKEDIRKLHEKDEQQQAAIDDAKEKLAHPSIPVVAVAPTPEAIDAAQAQHHEPHRKHRK